MFIEHLPILSITLKSKRGEITDAKPRVHVTKLINYLNTLFLTYSLDAEFLPHLCGVQGS